MNEDKKHILVDTNCCSMDVFALIREHTDMVLILPIKLVQELSIKNRDGLPQHNNILRVISDLQKDGRSITYDPEGISLPPSADKRVADDYIWAEALACKKVCTGDVILVTHDIALTVKAQAVGVKVMSMEEFLNEFGSTKRSMPTRHNEGTANPTIELPIANDEEEEDDTEITELPNADVMKYAYMIEALECWNENIEIEVFKKRASANGINIDEYGRFDKVIKKYSPQFLYKTDASHIVCTDEKVVARLSGLGISTGGYAKPKEAERIEENEENSIKDEKYTPENDGAIWPSKETVCGVFRMLDNNRTRVTCDNMREALAQRGIFVERYANDMEGFVSHYGIMRIIDDNVYMVLPSDDLIREALERSKKVCKKAVSVGTFARILAEMGVNYKLYASKWPRFIANYKDIITMRNGRVIETSPDEQPDLEVMNQLAALQPKKKKPWPPVEEMLAIYDSAPKMKVGGVSESVMICILREMGMNYKQYANKWGTFIAAYNNVFVVKDKIITLKESERKETI